ncbi:hypothetical protein [Carboxylicivirga sp. M1479]|uniref:hypothetical protein n=1 Tax=Carboxylicivirga sp. M1479 TaxID=2594476 RepID=UPI0011776464|nr:hypothetical protein [Carboxylicivirga sp. M1479]TRX70487.1 hypothetical protein FNN09_10945 [Carboxylicivirga sp. M1479]
MPHLDDYTQKLEEAKALANDQVLYPYMPISVYCQEAEDLAVWATHDLAQLAAAGLSETIITDLNIWSGATHHAQSLWMKEKKSQKEAEEEWATKSPLAYDFRNQLLHGLRYAFRKHPNLLALLAEIDEGNSDADMVQDLSDLSVLGIDNPELIQKAGISIEDMNKAATMSDDMGLLRARSNGEKHSGNEYLDIRNRMYTQLKTLVDEVRACGKFVFWRDSKRVKGYASQYNRQNRG